VTEPNSAWPDGSDAALKRFSYMPLPGVHDEMMDAEGGIRPEWRDIMERVGALSDQEIAELATSSERLVRENGTTYNVFEEAGEAARPWRLDPLPLLIGAEEWKELEVGLIQRARLLNEILEDIHGAQDLLSRGLLPSALVHGNPNFLRPLHGIRPAGGIHLNFLAFDLARAPDRRWWVLSDRTQTPSGAGYALENRIVLSRTLSEIFRDNQVQRLAGFFQAASDGMVALTGKDDPLIVLLTSGPGNQTYFEQAYLARYLGFPLVEGADLTARDNKIYLKTLNGLRQVDLIFRRVDGDFCDPLELRTDSMLGVAGLVSAVRAGNVVVANSLGSGVVECEALMGYLPRLCETLLGEELRLPSLATWWCGEETAKSYVLENLDHLVIQRTFSNRSIMNRQFHAVLLGEVDMRARDVILEQLDRRDYELFAQESLTLSTAPSLSNGGLVASPMTLRVFVCSDGKGGYRVMPGGLARTTDKTDAQAIEMRQGDASKDTWVLSDIQVAPTTRLPAPDQPLTLRRSGSNLPSRVADNLYWLGRYAQRTEDTVRLLRSLILRLTVEAGASDDPRTLARLTKILVDLGYVRPRVARRAAARGIQAVEREIAVLLFDRECPSGLLNLIEQLGRTASLVRERLSIDSWRILNGPHDLVHGHASMLRLDADVAVDLLDKVLEELAAFSGMQMENMIRSQGWRLLDMGRRIERTVHMAKLIREIAVEGEPEEEGGLDLLLELGDSSMTYRTRYLASVQTGAVVDLLLTDETNPRSVAFQVMTLADHITHLPNDLETARPSREQFLVTAMMSDLRLADVQSLCDQRDRRGNRSDLSRFLIRQETHANELSQALAGKYFSHAVLTRGTWALGSIE